MASKGTRASILLLLCLALYPVALVRLILLPIDGSTLWRGYYTLVLPERASVPEVEARLHAAGFSTISAWGARLRFTDFSGKEEVPVADISHRFIASDPRLDPYMRAAARLFHAGSESLIYLKARSGLLLTELELRSALVGLPWRLADAGIGREAGGLALLLIAATLILALGGSRPRLLLVRIAGLLPWIPLAATGMAGLVATSLLLYSGWALLIERLPIALDEWASHGRFEPKGLASGIAVTLAALLGVALLEGGSPGLLVVMGEALTADLALAGLIWAARLKARKRRRRQPTASAAPVRPSMKRPPVDSLGAMLMLALLVAGVFPFDRIDRGATRLPAPVFVAGASGWSEATLARLSRMRSDGLPDIASYIEHRAFQEGLAYGGTYGFPAPGERITIPSFRRERGRFVETPETVVSFGGEWYSRVLREGDGLTPLFRAQLRPSLTARVSVGDRLGLGSRSWLLFPIAALLLVPAIGLGEGLTPLFMYGMRSSGSRRKQQAA